MVNVGEVYENNVGLKFVVIEYNGCNDVKVKFVDSSYTTFSTTSNIRTGSVKDKMSPSVYGVGVVGVNSISTNQKLHQEYVFWNSMLQRCYDEKYHSKQPTYKDCCVSEDFKYYPYFKDWCNKQVGFGNKGWCLDKDILVKGNKLYSEDTCCFVPREINSLFALSGNTRGLNPIGVQFNLEEGNYSARVSRDGKHCHIGTYETKEDAFLWYKEAKELHIKSVAKRWFGKIDQNVFNALMTYEVGILD